MCVESHESHVIQQPPICRYLGLVMSLRVIMLLIARLRVHTRMCTAQPYPQLEEEKQSSTHGAAAEQQRSKGEPLGDVARDLWVVG